MVVASGQLPAYQYEWPTPFRIRSNQDTGISGILLEAAQFVMQAEMRKFFALEAFTQQWKVYTNTNLVGSGYDPKPKGETLDGLVGPKVVVALDYIATMRNVMVDAVFGDAYRDFSEYVSNEILQDWIRQTYPESPSGYLHNATDDFQGQFLRPVLQDGGEEYVPGFFGSADPLIGVFIDSDPHWLGGSGIIMDIDLGEVMWNPYPIAVASRGDFDDTHGSRSSWNIDAFPMYPSFQKLNGNLISLNGFENPLPADPVPSKIVRDYAPTGSGKVRYVCYPTLGSTNFYLGDINTIVGSPQGIQFSTDQMTVAAISAAPLGESFINVPGSVVFLNTIPLGTGVYRIAARNNKTNYPMTTVESGIISQWPKPKDISDETFFANVSTSYHGYEVFNNAFWVTDWGAFINNSIGVSDFDPVGPSGFSIHSPFTGRPLWQRNSTSALAAVISNDLSVPANNSNTNWTQNLLSLNRTGVDSIVRLAGLSPGSFIGGVSFDIIIAIYNDLINSVSNITTTLSLSPTNINSNTTKVYSMVWDGNHHWVIGESTAVIGPQRFVWELDATFSEVARYDSSLAPLLFNRTGAISDGLGGPIRYFQFEDTSLNISEWIPGGGVITTGSTKAIDINSIIPGTVVNSEICSILEVNGISELDSGAYALIRVRTNLANNRFYIVRIEEGLTTWNVRGLWFIKNLPLDFNLEQVSTLLPDKRMGMIVMPIN